MGWDYDTMVARIATTYAAARVQRGFMMSRSVWALTHWQLGDDHDAIYDLIAGLDFTINCVENLYDYYYFGYGANTYAVPTTLDRNMANDSIPESEAADVTMDSILSAMVSATEDEFKTFIGVIDGYRVAMWNKPFNSEFFAALARGFME